jgi:hypothetical protein
MARFRETTEWLESLEAPADTASRRPREWQLGLVWALLGFALTFCVLVLVRALPSVPHV